MWMQLTASNEVIEENMFDHHTTTPGFARMKHPARDKMVNITTGRLPLASKLGTTGRALLKQLKQLK